MNNGPEDRCAADNRLIWAGDGGRPPCSIHSGAHWASVAAVVNDNARNDVRINMVASLGNSWCRWCFESPSLLSVGDTRSGESAKIVTVWSTTGCTVLISRSETLWNGVLIHAWPNESQTKNRPLSGAAYAQGRQTRRSPAATQRHQTHQCHTSRRRCGNDDILGVLNRGIVISFISAVVDHQPEGV